MNPDKVNLSAYKYAESKLGDILSICDPLFRLNIKIFAYFRFFPDGKYMYLCNNLEWVRFCLQNVHNNEGTSLGKEIGHVAQDDYHCYLWPIKRTDYLMSALYDFNIWNGLSIFKQREDSIELWGFASDREAENLQNFYIQNIELLKAFTASFNSDAAEIIMPKVGSLAIYKDFKSPEIYIDEYRAKKISEFIKATPIHKHPIITQAGEIFLTKRELQCVNLLASGKNAKQIALHFKVSPRTIEKHFENIKNKLGFSDKETVIKVYKESILNWL